VTARKMDKYLTFSLMVTAFLTKRFPDSLDSEGHGAVSVYAQPHAPVIDRLFTQISAMLKDMDEGVHAIPFLNFFNKI